MTKLLPMSPSAAAAAVVAATLLATSAVASDQILGEDQLDQSSTRTLLRKSPEGGGGGGGADASGFRPPRLLQKRKKAEDDRASTSSLTSSLSTPVKTETSSTCVCVATKLGRTERSLTDRWCTSRSDLVECTPPWGIDEDWYRSDYCSCSFVDPSTTVTGLSPTGTADGGSLTRTAGDGSTSAVDDSSMTSTTADEPATVVLQAPDAESPCGGVLFEALTPGTWAFMDRSTSRDGTVDGGPTVIEPEDAMVKVELYNTVIDRLPTDGMDIEDGGTPTTVFAVTYEEKGGVARCEVMQDIKRDDKIGSFDAVCDPDSRSAQLDYVVGRPAQSKEYEADDGTGPCDSLLQDAAAGDGNNLHAFRVTVDCRSRCTLAPTATSSSAATEWRVESNPPLGGIAPCAPPDTCLTQADFDRGTLRITSPGKYMLTQDIVFDPNPPPTDSSTPVTDVLDGCCRPTQSQIDSGEYDALASHLGFFAAISIETDDVEIDLNGFTLEQSRRHAILQRFFAIIELADRPFISGQGPSNFGFNFRAAANVVVRNGRLGLSSHHGIHGNGNVNVLIKDIIFDGFEVAAAALNGASGLTVEGCTATNRKDVALMGMYNAAILIRAFCKQAVNAGVTLTVQGRERPAADICVDLDEAIFKVYEDVYHGPTGFIDKTKHPEEYGLFHNPSGFIDGNIYGFLTNKMGVAVNGFPSLPEGGDGGNAPAIDVVFRDCVVRDLLTDVDEVPALRAGGGRLSGTVSDAAGAVFQTRNVHPDDGTPLTLTTLDNDAKATYSGNVVSDAQVLVAKCKHLGLCQAPRNRIPPSVVDFVEQGRTLRETLEVLVDGEALGANNTNGYVCNIDSVGHVNKGLIAYKLDATEQLTVENCRVEGAVNFGRSGLGVCGADYGLALPAATYSGYGGADARGYSVAGSERVVMRGCSVERLRSEAGMAVGYDIHTNSDGVCLEDADVLHVYARGALPDGTQASEYVLSDLGAYGVKVGPNAHSVSVQVQTSGSITSTSGEAEVIMNEGTSDLGSGCPFLASQILTDN